MEDMKKLSKSPSTSFSSLPYDLVLNCLARISRFHRPTLSLVSKSFRSLLASRELQVTRTLIGKTEDCLNVCLDLAKKNPNPRWFALAPVPQQHKLIPVPDSFSYQHPETSTILSMGPQIYLIDGLVNEKSSTRVLILDSSQYHHWRSLLPEKINGKFYVIGGCNEHDKFEHWGEVYDPNTRSWESLSPTTLDHHITQKSVVPGNRLVMGGETYAMNGLKLNFKAYVTNERRWRRYCLAEIETNVWCQIFIDGSELQWLDPTKNEWMTVKGLEKLSTMSCFASENFAAVAKSGGRRVTVWWKTDEYRSDTTNKCKTDIWCAEISLQRQGVKELKGFIEWSKSVFTFNGPVYDSLFLLHSVLVNHC